MLIYCIPYPKKRRRQKKMNFFANDKILCHLLVLSILTDIFFYKGEYLVFSNLKVPLVYLFDFKFD